MAKKRIEVTDVNYNQKHLVEVDEKYFPQPAGVVIQVEEDVTLESPNPSWEVPKLTAEQVTQAYNGLVAGKSVVVENSDGTVQYSVVLGVGLTEEPAIMLVHYWLGFIDYQVSNDEVVITGHELQISRNSTMYLHSVAITGEDINWKMYVISTKEQSITTSANIGLHFAPAFLVNAQLTKTAPGQAVPLIKIGNKYYTYSTTGLEEIDFTGLTFTDTVTIF